MDILFICIVAGLALIIGSTLGAYINFMTSNFYKRRLLDEMIKYSSEYDAEFNKLKEENIKLLNTINKINNGNNRFENKNRTSSFNIILTDEDENIIDLLTDYIYDIDFPKLKGGNHDEL